jgi:large subunit ribosomal protein L15e
MYKHLEEVWKRPKYTIIKDIMRQRTIKWRKEPVITRIEKPTRINRARRLGYKAKKGVIVVRIRIRKGGRRKQRPRMGRRQKRMGVAKITPRKSIQLIAEERVSKKFPNLEVLNSYWVWQDGRNKWFEVILEDTNYPHIKNKKNTHG